MVNPCKGERIHSEGLPTGCQASVNVTFGPSRKLNAVLVAHARTES
jgi:hypothetical protein